MAFFTQSRFPFLWNAFQYAIGGVIDKRRLCLEPYSGEKRVLEVGCSVGNIADAFINLPGVNYTGIDIDGVAIEYAKKRFLKHLNFNFIYGDMLGLPNDNSRYDYILFAGCCHHMTDEQCIDLLSAAAGLLTERGRLVVVDPLLPSKEDHWFIKMFIKLEQGMHLRNGDELRSIIEKVNGLKIENDKEVLVSSTPLGWPLCARFAVSTLIRA